MRDLVLRYFDRGFYAVHVGVFACMRIEASPFANCQLYVTCAFKRSQSHIAAQYHFPIVRFVYERDNNTVSPNRIDPGIPRSLQLLNPG
jgi:glutathionyl-hydroquinone reductase